MKSRSKVKLKVTITKIFDAEFDDILACSRMFRTLETDHHIGSLTGTSMAGWCVRQTSEKHSVDLIPGSDIDASGSES